VRGVQDELRLFNTLTRRKEVYRSINPGQVRMFVCGPTLQDYIHVGHVRTYVFYDVLARYLAYLGNSVHYVVNLTDIDEAIARGARKARVSPADFSGEYGKMFLEDMKSLGVGSVSTYEKVSAYLPTMIDQAKGLLANGSAYALEGNVYFSIDTFPDFGKLSHLSRKQILMRPLELSPAKRNQADFSLWRRGAAGEQTWPSPWGEGTPGWHIQDTAVSATKLGSSYDIHGGARELIYPHHEAEIAQMEALTGAKPFVRYWVHSGLLTTKKQKMSKSRGNVIRARDLLKDYDAGAIRLYLLQMHHTKDAEFSERSLKRYEEVFDDLRGQSIAFGSGEGHREKRLQPEEVGFIDALNDDLDTELATKILIRSFRERSPLEVRSGLAALATYTLGLELAKASN
jgi:cysteinyl-tRNA synthetase